MLLTPIGLPARLASEGLEAVSCLEAFVLEGLVRGAEGQNRTADTMIFSHVLYQLSYLGTLERWQDLRL
jgi:hypothetical protein